jgi:CubicO group peptidase (beta-lactamase class C family)
MDAAKLEQLATALGGRGCVIRDGYVVKAWGAQEQRGDWLSSAKPVLSTLLFFAIQEGKVRSVDARTANYGWGLSEKDRPMTFRHLAQMTSGYARPEAPGAAWAYNDYAIQLYQKTLFDKVFQEAPETVALDPRRLGALGLEDGLAFNERRRMSASVRDFARIAWFWLNEGKWNGKQVLARRFFREYRKPQVPVGLPQSAKAETDDYLKIGTFGGGSAHFTEFGPGIYGFNWWFNPKRQTWPDAPADAYMSIGAGGNCAVMIPSLRLVLVAARAQWGQLRPGDREAEMNRHMRLLVEAAGAKRR